MIRLSVVAASFRKTVLVVALVLSSAVFVSMVYPGSQAHAAGAVGDGGVGSGGTGAGYSYLYKYGWYMFDVSGGGPSGGFRNSTTWAGAQGKCNAVGANKIVAFVYHNSAGSQKIYSWQNENNPRNYKTGPGYMPVVQAKAYYDAMGGGAPTYVWGRTVGWFCYSDGPPPDVLKPPGSPAAGATSNAGCQPILITLNPGHDYYGRAVPITASTSKQSWTRSSYSQIDASQNHTTGGSFEVKYVTPAYVSDLSPNKGPRGEIVSWSPVTTSQKTTRGSIGPCYLYDLKPRVTTNRDSSLIIEPGNSIDVTARVSNNNPTIHNGPTITDGTAWQITQIVIKAGQNAPHKGVAGTSSSDPCAYFSGTSVKSCTSLETGSEAIAVGESVVSIFTTTAGDYEVGDSVCFAFSVKPHARNDPVSTADGYWGHSEPSPVPDCLTVGKRPKIQIHGGDLSVGRVFSGAPVGPRNVATSTSQKIQSGENRMFGSWVEYGIFATGQITGTASGSAYAGPTGAVGVDFCKFSTLSFKNTDASAAPCVAADNIGYSNIPPRSIPNFVASFPGSGSPISGSVVAGSLSGGVDDIYSSEGNVSLAVSSLPAGKTVILKVAGTVTITGNQTNFAGPYTSTSQLPQLVVIANKIIINGSVTNVDAWLIANGTDGIIETSDTGSSTYALTGSQRLKSAATDQTLTVNGPVMAKQLWLRRTAGSGTGDASGNPAEVFNLRPDAYLWAAAQARSSGRVQTVYTTELPSRL